MATADGVLLSSPRAAHARTVDTHSGRQEVWATFSTIQRYLDTFHRTGPN